MKAKNETLANSPIRDEVIEFHLEPLTDASKPRRLSGIAKEGNKINANRRYYSVETLKKAVEMAQDDLKAGKLIGLVSHPSWFSGPRGEVPDIGARYDLLTMKGSTLHFEGNLVRTAKGTDLEAVLDAGVVVGVSTNGTGTSKYLPAKEIDPEYPDSEELIQVVEDFRLLTIDFVMSPADPAGQVSADSLSLEQARAWLAEAQHVVADLERAQAKPAQEDDVKNLEELKEKHPELYQAALDAARKEVEAIGEIKKLEDELAAVKAQLTAREQADLERARKALVAGALAAAKLPKLGKAGEVDLDAKFTARLEGLALAAKDEAEAKTLVEAEIAERRVLLGNRTPPKIPGPGNNDAQLEEYQQEQYKQLDQDTAKVRKGIFN